MASRDPFPMQSEEARRLAASVEGGTRGSFDDDDEHRGGGVDDWHRMGTSTAVAGPTTSRKHESGTGAGDGDALVAKQVKKKKKKKKRRSAAAVKQTDDIYAQDELDELSEAQTDTDHAGGGTGDSSDDDSEGDAYLDRPLRNDGSPAAVFRSALPLWARRVFDTTGRTLRRIHKRLYGDTFPPSEILRTLCLSSTLFFMIGGYWLLRSLKDPILTALCGVSVIPKAKMLSVFVVLGVVSVYNRLLDDDRLKKEQLFYVFGMFYFALFSIISGLLAHPTIGLANQAHDPSRILGWISYCSIESFGSVMVSLFWSFANSNFSLKEAKASYGLLVATAQVGSILGPTVVNRFGSTWGLARCYFVGALCMLLLQGTMCIYVACYGTEESDKTTVVKKEKAGILEGLHLFARHNYVKGIFAISCLFMVEVTIVDYTMKVLARDHFASLHPCEPGMSCWDDALNMPGGMSDDATKAFTTFMGLFGQATNTLSFFLSLLGTSAVIRLLGLRLTLLLFPSLCLAVIVMVRLRPTLYVVFTAMMMLKACSYALNNPTKEMLYQPTSPAVKYKAKSWIDIFGARGSKALGSVVTNAFSDSASTLVSHGSLVGMAVASFLIWNARFMGKKFDEYTESGHVVGEDDADGTGKVYEVTGGAGNTASAGVEMAMVQNEGNDTSCAIYDDDEIGEVEEGQSELGEEEVDDDDEEEEENDAKETQGPSAKVEMV